MRFSSLLSFPLFVGAAALGCSVSAPPAMSSTGGSVSSSGGAALGNGGAVGRGGSLGTGGLVGNGGWVGTGGAAAGGTTANGGGAAGGQWTSGGNTGGMAAGGWAGGGSGVGGSSGGGAGGSAARFSFFMASQAGLARLAKNPNGFGGDLRFGKADGLSGADEICRQLAESSMPSNGKTWRAFLSVTRGPEGTPVHAIDRIGDGPWYDRLGRLVAKDKAALLGSRPKGADPIIQNDLPNEDGVPNHNPGTGIIDNHNVMTGSTAQGTIDRQGMSATCQDWTSSASDGGAPRCGVSWPRETLVHWISVINEGGCAPGATPGNGAQSGPGGTVGALGGYGAMYCMALTP